MPDVSDKALEAELRKQCQSAINMKESGCARHMWECWTAKTRVCQHASKPSAMMPEVTDEALQALCDKRHRHGIVMVWPTSTLKR